MFSFILNEFDSFLENTVNIFKPAITDCQAEGSENKLNKIQKLLELYTMDSGYFRYKLRFSNTSQHKTVSSSEQDSAVHLGLPSCTPTCVSLHNYMVPTMQIEINCYE